MPEREPGSRRGVLFLCVANSARSQMAEGLARAVAPASVPVMSAGSHPFHVHPMAVRVLEEIGIDISEARSKGLDEIPAEEVGTVVTLCEERNCPHLPGPVRRLHWPTDDPAMIWDESAQLQAFRRTRDDLRERIEALFAGPAGDSDP